MEYSKRLHGNVTVIWFKFREKGKGMLFISITVEMRKNITYLILMVLAFILGGCAGKQEEDIQYLYKESVIPVQEASGVYNIIAYENDRLYINSYQLVHNHVENDEENNDNTYGIAKIYTVNVDGSDLKEIPLDTVKEEYIQQMVVGKDSIITLLSESLSGTEKEEILVRIDESGQELARESLGNIIKQRDDNSLIKLLVADNGKIVLVTPFEIYLLDTDFNIINEQILIYDINNSVDIVRESFPVKRDRRKDLYRKLYE